MYEDIVSYTRMALFIVALLAGYPQVVFLAPVVVLLYVIIFRKNFRENDEGWKKIYSLQFFEDTLLELDYHKLLENLKKT